MFQFVFLSFSFFFIFCLLLNNFGLIISQDSTYFCKFIQFFAFEAPIGNVKTCFLALKSPANSPNSSISSRNDPVVGEMFIRGNKFVFYLPQNTNEIFPNLLGYSVTSCNVKEISNENFSGLTKLKGLYLWGNRIEKIASDTFQGLVKLEALHLGMKFVKKFCVGGFWE